jgi:hypothetical protein
MGLITISAKMLSRSGAKIDTGSINLQIFTFKFLADVIQASGLEQTPQYLLLSIPIGVSAINLVSSGRSNNPTFSGTAWRLENGTQNSISQASLSAAPGGILVGTYVLPARTNTYLISPVTSSSAVHTLQVGAATITKVSSASAAQGPIINGGKNNVDADNFYLIGSDSNDDLTGSGAADTLEGGDGNDTLQGWTGDDMLHGGSGLNLAIFSGNRADYSITTTGNAISGTTTVVDLQPAIHGNDGTDVLTGVRLLQFLDPGRRG